MSASRETRGSSPVILVRYRERGVQLDPLAVSTQKLGTRRMERPCSSAWNALCHRNSPSTSCSACFSPSSAFRRLRISFAALFVNVTAVISTGCSPWHLTRCATRHVRTRVFPDPGPAKIWSGTSGGEVTAEVSWHLTMQLHLHSPLSWAAFSDARYGYRSVARPEVVIVGGRRRWGAPLSLRSVTLGWKRHLG